MAVLAVDLNADLGEHSDLRHAAEDDALLDVVTSVNVACGFHAGNPLVIARTVEAALTRRVAVGAHPGLPDRANFGRKPMPMTPDGAYSLVLYQIGALDAFTRRWGGQVAHVKPHGALYHMAEADAALAEAIAYAVCDFRADLTLIGLSGGRLVQAGRARGLPVMQEVFADRTYQPNGTLTPRDDPAALIDDPQQAARRMALLLTTGALPAADGTPLVLKADTLCLHGDHAGAAPRARALRTALEAAGITLRRPAVT